jgi:single-stranded-DNA-specific exonuclease
MMPATTDTLTHALARTIVARPVAEQQLAKLAGVSHPVLRRIFAGRRVAGEDELDTSLSGLQRPAALLGMDAAVALLAGALERAESILVVGDFDADGATSSALMVSVLRAMGAANVGYLVPNRFEYGYGLTPEIVEVARARGPRLIVTVDNGISSLAGVAAARAHGIRVLVTDHHLPGEALPAADAIVNPNQPDDTSPSKALAGVGVAFYVLMALRAQLDAAGWFERRGLARPNLADYLDLVALGTVADLVPLDRNNRILVQQGLLRIRAGRCRPGIQALPEVAGRDRARVVASDFGFAVGPRLNAAGRLDDMSHGIECLLSEDRGQAARLAQRLDALNRERREIETDMKQQAIEVIEHLHLDVSSLPPGFCLYDADWHQGVIGILAARIKERFHRPVIAARHPQLLQKFGGHAMAAGLTLAEPDLPAFERAFHAELRRRVDAETLQGVLETDGELGDADFDLGFSELLRDAGPWGQGFPEPLFEGVFTVLSQRIVGAAHFKLTVQPQGSGRVLDAIAFHQAGQPPPVGQRLRLVYRLDSNAYRGLLSVQLLVEHIEWL